MSPVTSAERSAGAVPGDGGPLVSVVLAVHDGERYLAAAIDSIVAQTYRNFELIIIDDGSTDRSVAIVESYADPRIRLVHNGANLGLVASLNRGIALARGELVARMDADDVADAERLERQVARFARDPDLVVLGTGVRYVDASGASVGVPVGQPTGAIAVGWRLLRGNCVFHPSAMIHRERAAGELRYDPAFAHAEDYELWLRLCRHHSLDNLPDVLLSHRRHADSISSRYPRDQLAAAARALSGHVQREFGMTVPAAQAMALLDPRMELARIIGHECSPIPVILELERRFCARATNATTGELRGIHRDVAFFLWKLAATSLTAWGRGPGLWPRLALLGHCCARLLLRPRAALRALLRR